MEAYYDSDEEIAWGPLTLKEIKKELSTKRHVKERHSIVVTESKMSSFNTTMYHTTEEDINNELENDQKDNTTYITTSENISRNHSNIDENSWKTVSTDCNTSYHSSKNCVISHGHGSDDKIQQTSGIIMDDQIIDISSDDKENLEDVQQYKNKLPIIVHENKSILKEHSIFNIETIDLCLEDEVSNQIKDYSTDNSYNFNDTLEEMENALKELQIPMSNKIEQKKICDDSDMMIMKRKIQLNKYDYIVSPIGEYIRDRSPIAEKFKTPKPISKRTITTPISKNKHLRDIVSPVALYIKNTPTTPLRQNIPSNSNMCVPENRYLTHTTTNILKEMPKAMYKPSKNTKHNNINNPNLPLSIKNTVSLPVVTTHVEKTKKFNGSAIEKLADEDLTMASDTIESIDVSFYQNKQVFIK